MSAFSPIQQQPADRAAVKRTFCHFLRLLAVLLLAASWLPGQSPLLAQGGLQFEAWLRPQRTVLRNATENDLDPAVNERQRSWGMAAGLGAGYGLTERWSVWTGMGYSFQQQDYRHKSLLLNGQEQNVLRELRVEYLQLPLRAEFRPFVGKRLQAHLGAGVFAAGLLRAEERDDDRRYRPVPPPGVHYSRYPPRSATLKAWHFGVHGRAGVSFKLRHNLWACATLTLDYALNDVEDKNAVFLRTEAGQTESISYYSERHRQEFGAERSASRWMCLGLQCGVRYNLPLDVKP